jgi:hypothetical protein
MQYVPRLPQPTRSLLVPLMAATLLGAGVATATFALVNIDDDDTLSVPAPAVESAAPPSDAVAGQRADGGPAEGAAQQSMSTSTVVLRGSKASATAEAAAPRYDGGPEEGSSAAAIGESSGSSGPTPYGGARP